VILIALCCGTNTVAVESRSPRAGDVSTPKTLCAVSQTTNPQLPIDVLTRGVQRRRGTGGACTPLTQRSCNAAPPPRCVCCWCPLLGLSWSPPLGGEGGHVAGRRRTALLISSLLLNSKLKTLNSKPQTPRPSPQTLYPIPYTLDYKA